MYRTPMIREAKDGCGVSGERQRHDRGFTLIELLVVIVILGIISGVVVFAVRGAGDKGEANAKAADKRIVRTAMETFCARYGRYAEDMDELVKGPRDPNNADVRLGKGFLSNESTYNHTIVSVPPGANNCSGTGYQIDEPSKCVRLDGEEETVDAAPGLWCLAASPPDKPASGLLVHSPLVQLLDGRVLTIMPLRALPSADVLGKTSSAGHDTQVFDPADGVTGAWQEGAVARIIGGMPTDYADRFGGMVLLDHRKGHPEDCSPNCGKVLAYFLGGSNGSSHWKLYDPDGDDGVDGTVGAWEAIDPPSSEQRSEGAEMVQLRGPGCGEHCGKVLIVAKSNNCSPAFVELYDPRTGSFERMTLYLYEHGSYNFPYCPRYGQLTELDTGRVLLVTQSTSPSSKSQAILFTPADGSYDQITPSKYRYVWDYDPTVLPEGRGILFVNHAAGGAEAEIYKPDGGEGTWATVASCATSDLRCHVTARLPDGRVLVQRNKSITYWGRPDEVWNDFYLFDSSRDEGSRWAGTGSLNDPKATGAAVLLERGACRPNCNRVLIVGDRKAEMYVP